MTTYWNGSLMIATGHDMPPGSLQPIETWFGGIPPRAQPISKGAVATVTASGKRRFDGDQRFQWEYAITDYANLDQFIIDIAGSWENENTDVTVMTLVRGATYATANATLLTPAERTDDNPQAEYTPDTTFKITGLRLRFCNVERTGAFSSGFSVGFDI